jgi:hypothetical protein
MFTGRKKEVYLQDFPRASLQWLTTEVNLRQLEATAVILLGMAEAMRV